MNELFGLSMNWIAGGCVVVTGLILLFIAWIAVRNPVMFKTGLRNIPRRKMQTALIVIGLMLSTLIITAAFGTGDTMTHSVTREAYTILGPADEIIAWDTERFPAAPDDQTIPLTQVREWQATFADDPEINAIVPFLSERMPVQNVRTRLNEANPRITAFRPEDVAAFGGLKDLKGKPVTLGPRDIALNEELAGNIDAKVGDLVLVFYEGQPTELKVVAIVPNTLLGGTNDTLAREGAAVEWDFLAQTVRRIDQADFVVISNDGTTRGGIASTNAVAAKFRPVLRDTTYKLEKIKQDNIRQAQFVGNLFTSIFIIFGLFSISAGILLIFLIFIMLAAERKPEMGMARAVGAKRRQIVESFLAEGMGYDIGAAVVGLFAGIGVSIAMIAFVKLRIGEELGLDLQFNVTPRSLVISFCLGIIVTFIVVFIASWRASRLNIVSAIRDLPESKPHDPEQATWTGYLRAALNGFAAFGVLLVSVMLLLHVRALAPIAGLAALMGLSGPWLGLVRNHNFGAANAVRKQGDRLPVWPWFIPIVGWVGFPIAILIVRLTRERRPKSLPKWLMVAGIVIAPLGLVLSALQDRGRQVATNVGAAFVGMVAGLILIQWGLGSDTMAFLALGVSLVAFWAAATLRYFRLAPERLVFTAVSVALLAFWYVLPGGRLESVLGTLKAGPEMFFVTGAVLVMCGTFIVVYNADIILPAIAAVGSRFGRLLPAVKMAVAYPLTSKFRTGLTIAMIGLIMFVLSMQAALNINFERTFTGDDALGGFNTRVIFNGNNTTDDFSATLREANALPGVTAPADPGRIEAAGENRIAQAFETDIQDPEFANKPEAKRKPEDEFKSLQIEGLDPVFIANQKLPLQHRAAGFETDDAVWKALAGDPKYAIIPSSLTADDGGFGPGAGELLTLPPEYVGDGFVPFVLRLRNPGDQSITEVTVIGQTKDSAFIFWPGLIVQKSVVEKAFPEAKGQVYFLALRPGTDAKKFAKGVESALVQVQADSMEQIVADTQAQQRTFLELFQGFLALGLLVGIAALGVISLRAVVERRQQIGMLRAIGYKRSMVQASFLLESGFIALSGIILGVGLGLTFAASLFTSGEFGASTEGLAFEVPWGQVGLMTAIAFLASMGMTYWPARAASHVAVAEALRYE